MMLLINFLLFYYTSSSGVENVPNFKKVEKKFDHLNRFWLRDWTQLLCSPELRTNESWIQVKMTKGLFKNKFKCVSSYLLK